MTGNRPEDHAVIFAILKDAKPANNMHTFPANLCLFFSGRLLAELFKEAADMEEKPHLLPPRIRHLILAGKRVTTRAGFFCVPFQSLARNDLRIAASRMSS